MGTLLREVDVRVADLPSDQRKGIEVLSLTKRFGLIPQSERFNKRVATANVDNYKIVRRGWIVYNPYVIWEGAIHALKRDTPGIVSPVYPVWERIDNDGGFLDLILRTPALIAAYEKFSAGAVNRRRSIKKDGFLSIEIATPSLAEQRKIAGLLSLLQRAIEQQQQMIALTAELKSALLHKLFTEGVRGELQKETEIGPVPESWETGTLENASLAVDYGTSVKCEAGKAGFPVLRIPNVVSGSIDLGDLKHGQPKRTELEALRLRDGDLLFVRTNGALENAGRCALYRGELEDCYFASYLIRLRVDCSKVLPAFVNEYARTEQGRSFLSGRAIQTADGKFNINSGTLKRVLLPLPSIEEQTEIVRQLDVVERKLKLHEAKHATLTDLFRTLLHQLMTAQIRVHDLDLPELESAQ